MKKNRTTRGFTLAELLIVVAIIGVLVAVAIPVFSSSLEKAREATCKANRRSLLGIVSTAAMLDSSFLPDAGDYDIQAVQTALAVSGNSFTDEICPSDGKITVTRVVEGGGFIVTCSVHKGATTPDDGEATPNIITVSKGYLSDFTKFTIENVGTLRSNDKIREEFFKEFGSPTMIVDGSTYYIEPFYQDKNKDTNQIWLFAKSSTDSGWNASFIYNPIDENWYRPIGYDGTKYVTRSITFTDCNALNNSIKNDLCGNGTAPGWRLIPADQISISSQS